MIHPNLILPLTSLLHHSWFQVFQNLGYELGLKQLFKVLLFQVGKKFACQAENHQSSICLCLSSSLPGFPVEVCSKVPFEPSTATSRFVGAQKAFLICGSQSRILEEWEEEPQATGNLGCYVNSHMSLICETFKI